MTKLLIATKNKKKLAEIEAIFSDFDLEYLTLKDFPHIEEPEETGSTFSENALEKARYYSKVSGLLALAEDSGICVDALGGRPGVVSARYAGPRKNDDDNLDKVLSEIRDIPQGKRQAHYKSAVAVAGPGGREFVVEGKVEGELLFERRGTGGFGYDPIFYYPPFQATFAEVPQEKKNSVSHRFHALQAAREKLREIIQSR